MYFYPRPPWGGRLLPNFALIPTRAISIHALRGEGDGGGWRNIQLRKDFYPRPPWGGRPRYFGTIPKAKPISIHALRGEGDRLKLRISPNINLFLSTPSVGRATRLPAKDAVSVKFLSTPSVGRATVGVRVVERGQFKFLSTPSVGRATPCQSPGLAVLRNFYPRPPWGGRPARP